MTPEEVASHRECEFGKWFHGPGQAMADNPLYAEVERHHEKVHAIARDVVARHREAGPTAGENKLAEFDDARKELFETLDKLYLA